MIEAGWKRWFTLAVLIFLPGSAVADEFELLEADSMLLCMETLAEGDQTSSVAFSDLQECIEVQEIAYRGAMERAVDLFEILPEAEGRIEVCRQGHRGPPADWLAMHRCLTALERELRFNIDAALRSRNED